MKEYSTPHVIRVDIHPGIIYVLIVTDPDGGKSFYLIHEQYGNPIFMFKCYTENDAESVELAKTNALLYYPDCWE